METFDKLRIMIENNRLDDSKPYFWELYLSNVATKETKRAEKVGHNYTIADKEQSLEILQQNMQIMQENGFKYFILVLKTSATSPNGFTIPMPNPMYKGYGGYGSPGIGSINTNNINSSTSQLMQLQREMHEMRMEHMAELHKIETERLREEINGALNHKETVIDKVITYMSKPEFAPLIAGLIGRFAAPNPATIAAPVSAPAPAPAAIEKNVDANHDADLTEQEQFEQAKNVITLSINRIQEVFPNDTLQFMDELSYYVLANPDQAKSIRTMIQQQQKANG